MRITSRQLRQIIREALGDESHLGVLDQVAWQGAAADVEKIMNKSIPFVTDDSSREDLSGLMLALEHVLIPGVVVKGGFGNLARTFLGPHKAVAELVGGDPAAINVQLVAVRHCLNLPATGGWDSALEEEFNKFLKALDEKGGFTGVQAQKRAPRKAAPKPKKPEEPARIPFAWGDKI